MYVAAHKKRSLACLSKKSKGLMSNMNPYTKQRFTIVLARERTGNLRVTCFGTAGFVKYMETAIKNPAYKRVCPAKLHSVGISPG